MSIIIGAAEGLAWVYTLISPLYFYYNLVSFNSFSKNVC
jgi:hypothetical protein